MPLPLDLISICRLLEEDPESWRCDALGDMWHTHLPVKIEFSSVGCPKVNGFTLGWWGAFVLRRALKRYWRRSVDTYLTTRRERVLDQEMAEADRLLNG